MNIAKKIRASANCRYGDPPVMVKKKIPSNATAHTAVATLRLGCRTCERSRFVTRQSYGQVSNEHRKAIHQAAGEFSEGHYIHWLWSVRS